MSSNRGAGAQGQPNAANTQKMASGQALDLKVAARTDTGRSRPHNEDYVDYYIPVDLQERARRGAIYLAADGMGGHSAGEVASSEAVEVTRREYYADSSPDTGTSLVRAFKLANRRIHEWAQSDPTKSGMGTTLVAAVVLGRKVYVANVGDSRAYLVSPKGITQLTIDHSWVGEQIQAGLVTPEEARHHPQRNVVTRALGAKPSVEVDLFQGQLGEGDILLLCTDGLTGHVTDAEIAAITRDNLPEEAAQKLIDLANERGGSDNIGLVIVSAQDEAPFVATEISPVRETGLAPRLIWALTGLAAVLLAVLLLLGGYYLFSRITTGPEPTPDPSLLTPLPPQTTDTVAPVPAPVLPTETLSATVETAQPVPGSGSPTATLRPTDIARPTEPTTEQEGPVAPAQPTSTLPPPTPAPTPFPAPVLLEPANGAALENKPQFRWDWKHGPLPEDHYFDLRIWSDRERDLGEGARLGAVEPTRRTTAFVGLAGVPAIQKHGTGTYYWSVVIVEDPGDDSPLAIVGEWAPERSFTYSAPGGEDEEEEEPLPDE